MIDFISILQVYRYVNGMSNGETSQHVTCINRLREKAQLANISICKVTRSAFKPLNVTRFRRVLLSNKDFYPKALII